MDYDIVISGGGIAGLIAAAAFGSAGFATLCVDPSPPVLDAGDPKADLRSTAFLQPSQQLLSQIGLWDALAPMATPLQTMRIVDAGGPEAKPRISKSFDASDISDQPFGWNLPNALLRTVLSKRLADIANVTFLPAVATTRVFTRTTGAKVTLSDGQKVTTRLVVAADGRDSPTRQAAGIGVSTTRFGQKALVFAVSHPIPHGNVSTEIHRSGGPFTLVPLPDHEGLPASAVVWMEDGPKAEKLVQLDPPEFEAQISERACYLLGPLRLISPRGLWPIIAQKADRLTAQRVALVAEAAHVVPPIGAQGLNTSLADIAVLRQLAMANPDDLGSPEMLAKYQNARARDIQMRVAGVTALNRASQTGLPALQELRAKGLDLLYGVTPLRKSLMHLGMGISAKDHERQDT